VVTAPTQYVGYGPGKNSYAEFSAATRYVRIRTYIRWEIAKAALKASAIVDPPPYAYLEFRTCSGAAATPGRTKIGGNEFFLTVADKKAAIDKAVEQGK